MNLSSWIAAILICIIMAIALFVGLTGCADIPKIQPTTCEMNVTDKTCWVDKSANTGHSWPEMDGYFCMSSTDMVNVVQHLNECKSVVP